MYDVIFYLHTVLTNNFSGSHVSIFRRKMRVKCLHCWALYHFEGIKMPISLKSQPAARTQQQYFQWIPLGVKYGISAVDSQMWFCIFSKVSQFSLEFVFPFCASFYVRYCEYSGVHGADSRAEAPSHAACSAVGTLRQPHRSLHTGRERSCHQVGAHRIVINAANSHLTAFIFA